MTPSRLLFALSCLSLGVCLVRCGGDDPACEDCGDAALSGLTVLTPDRVAIGSCAPAQIVQLDGSTTARPTSELRLALEGDTTWYADAGCTVQATRATANVGSRGAIAYVKADSSGVKRARARVSGGAGGQTTFEASALSGTASAVKVSATRYADTTACVPVWVAAADGAGVPASLSNDVVVNLAARGTAFFSDSSCVSGTTTASIGPGRESAIVFAQFGLPGDVTVSAGASNLSAGSASVNVEGDQQLRLTFDPAGDSIALTAGQCTPVGIGLVDLAGVPLAVGAMDVTLMASGATSYSDAACTAETMTTTIRGSSSTIYLRATRAGNAELEARLANSQSRKVSLTVSAGPAVALALNGSVRMTQGGCYRYSVTRVDAFDNPAPGPAGTVTLTSASLGIFSDATCSTAASTVGFSAESSSATVYLRSATAVADATISSTLAGLTAATRTVDVVGAPTAVAVTASASAVAGTCSPARVTTVDAGGIPTDTLTADTIGLDSSPANVAFFRDASCGTPVNAVVINPLTNAAAVWVRGTVATTYDLSFASSTLPTVIRAFSITPADPATILIAGSDRMNLGDCSPLTLTLSDAFGNATVSAEAFTVELPAPGLGMLHATDSCTGAVSSVSFPSSTSSRQVFYEGAALGADVVSAVATALTQGTLELEVVFFMGDARPQLANVPFTRSFAIDPVDSTVMYRLGIDGMVWRSADAGASWVQRCKTSVPDPDYGAGFIISPAADGTAYVNTGHANQVFRVDALDGDACTSIVSGLSTIYAYRVVTGVSVDSTGRLFAWNGCCDNTNLHVSDDYGASWTELYDDETSTAWMGFMANHPTNSQLKVVDRAFAGTGNGLYRSTNGGVSWTFITATGFNDTENAIKFDPAHAGYVYKIGRSSSTDGAVWAADAAYNDLSLSWALDGSGAAYKFDMATAASTVVMRAPDARTPVWTAVTGTIAVPFSNASTRMSVAADGQRIGVLTGRDVYLSANAGTEFARLPTPGSAEGFPLSYAAPSAVDGYAIGSTIWVTLATHDGGVTWEGRGVGNSTAMPMIHVNPAFPDAVYVRGEDFNSTYDEWLLATQDGFATLREVASGAAWSWAGVGGVSLADPLAFMTLGSGQCRRTLDGGVSYTSRSCPAIPNVWYPAPIGWLSPASNDIMWYAGNASGTQGLFQVSWTDGASIDITNRTGVAPAGLEMYADGVNLMRVVSTTGQLVTSSNLGLSFGGATSASADGNCQARFLTSVPGQPASVAHACINSSTIAVSRTGGESWTLLPVNGCQVRQIAMLDAAMVVSCGNQAARTVLY